MRVNTNYQKTVGMTTISNDQFEELHFASLEILESVGVKVFEEEALALLKEAGAEVDGNLVRIPSWLVNESLSSAPCRVAVSNRSGKRTMFLEKGRSYY